MAESPTSRSLLNVKKDFQANQYNDPDLFNEYTHETGLIVLPLAKHANDAGRRTRVVRLHAPIGMRRVRYAATKKGTPPLTPRLEDTENDKFLGASFSVAMPAISGDQTSMVWTVVGEYLFVQDVFGTSPGTTPAAGAQGTDLWKGYLGRPRDHTTGFHTGEHPFKTPTQEGSGFLETGMQAVVSGILATQVPKLANAVTVDLTDLGQGWFTTYYGSQFFTSGVIS